MEKGNVVWYNMKNFIEKGGAKMADILENQDAEEMTATDAILRTVQQLAEKCETLEEFRKALE